MNDENKPAEGAPGWFAGDEHAGYAHYFRDRYGMPTPSSVCGLVIAGPISMAERLTRPKCPNCEMGKKRPPPRP